MSPKGLRHPLIFIAVKIPLKNISFIKIYKRLFDTTRQVVRKVRGNDINEVVLLLVLLYIQVEFNSSPELA